MRILSFLAFASTVFAYTRYDFINNPKLAQQVSQHPPHTNFTLPKINFKPYHPSKKQLNDLRKKVASSPRASKLQADAAKSSASNPLQGVIAAFIQPYGFVGYVALNLTSFFHTTPLTGDLAAAALVTLPSATPPNNFDLAIANATAPFLGVIDGYSGPLWGAGKPGYGSMTWVQHSTYPASNTNNPTGLPSESIIWNFNTATSELTAVWFNNDGTQISTTIFLDYTYGDMNFTGDLPAYLQVYPDNCFVTTLYFVPLSYFGL